MPPFDESFHADPVAALAVRVIALAVQDLHRPPLPRFHNARSEMLEFFVSDWYDTLLDIIGVDHAAVERMIEQYSAGRRRKAIVSPAVIRAERMRAGKYG